MHKIRKSLHLPPAYPRHPNPAPSPLVNFFVVIKFEDTLYELSFFLYNLGY